jgi:hypothetical protein
MLVIAAGAGLAYLFGFWWWGSARWGLRWSLCTVLGGLLTYIYFSSGLPGGSDLIQRSGTMGIIVITAVGILLGWLAAVAWRTRSLRAAHKKLSPKNGHISGEK